MHRLAIRSYTRLDRGFIGLSQPIRAAPIVAFGQSQSQSRWLNSSSAFASHASPCYCSSSCSCSSSTFSYRAPLNTCCARGRNCNCSSSKSLGMGSGFGFGGQRRSFAAAAAEADPDAPSDPVLLIEAKVIDAVKKFVWERAEDVRRDLQESKNASKKDDLERHLQTLETTEVAKTTKWADLAFDEFDQVEVLLEVEEAFDAIIPDDASDKIESVDQAIEYIHENKLHEAA